MRFRVKKMWPNRHVKGGDGDNAVTTGDLLASLLVFGATCF